MDKVPKSAARRSDSDGDIPSIGDMQRSAIWEDRLAEARIRRAQILAQRNQDGINVVDTAGVQKSTNLNIRLAKAHDRNGKSLVDRVKVGATDVDLDLERAEDPNKKTVLAALAGVHAKQTATAQPDGATVTPVAESALQTTAPTEPRERRSGAVYFAAAVVIALLIAVALPGQFRDFTVRSVNQVAGIFAGSPVDTTSPKDDDTVAANVTPSVRGQEALIAARPRDEIATAAMVVEQPNAPNNAPPPAAVAPSAMIALPAMPGISDASSSGAAIRVPALVAGSARQSRQVAFLAGTLSDPLPALPDAPSAAPASGEIATSAVAVERLNLATDAAALVAVAPSAMIAVTAMPQNSEVSTSSSALQSSAIAGSAASIVLLATVLADPLGADAPVKMPGPATPIRIASNYPATTAFADVIESIKLDARLPGLFHELAPSVVFVSLPQSTTPGDAPAALVSPEPLVSALANAPITRPAGLVDPAENVAAQAAIEGFDVLVHAPLSWSDTTLSELTAVLRATGYSIRSPVRVRFKISRDNVRYFHASDAEAAGALAAAFGASVRDFTDYKPAPRVGRIEVWLAGNSPPRNAARPSAPAAQSTGSQGPALLLLRDKLVEILRRGDHL